ncbi:DUF975 family protein [Methanosarcina sp. KYL-1]|uniref:DUF975 family protein n=1 Tax=Methanosarcina sp. KYL-1 TaxID=2602068 RepID=UPI002101568A|nr:DUF975 family protein [Methanosarcina sp. KYL-1]
MLLSSRVENGLDPAALSTEELYALFAGAFLENFVPATIGFIAFFLLIAFLQAFFTAGAIGMAKRAAETGDTVLSEMVGAGSKNAIKLFLASLLIGLMVLAGIIFVVPGALAVGDLGALIENPEVPVQGLGLLAIGTLIWGVYIMVINIGLSLAPYALVIDELDPLEAISTGFRFFMENKLDVFFIWVISIALTFVNSLVSELLGSVSDFVVLLTVLFPLLVLQPLTTVWWTRLYLSRKEKNLYDHNELLCDPDEFMSSC